MFFQPGIKTLWMVYVTTWHKHSLHSYLYHFATYCTSWWLQLTLCVLFAMLIFNFNNRQFPDSLTIRSLFLSSSFSLLFRHSPSHFKKINIRCKVLIEISHKQIRTKSFKHLVHSEKFMSTEQLLEVSEDIIKHEAKTFFLTSLTIQTR